VERLKRVLGVQSGKSWQQCASTTSVSASRENAEWVVLRGGGKERSKAAEIYSRKILARVSIMHPLAIVFLSQTDIGQSKEGAFSSCAASGQMAAGTRQTERSASRRGSGQRALILLLFPAAGD
jgi:hypothetical protein